MNRAKFWLGSVVLVAVIAAIAGTIQQRYIVGPQQRDLQDTIRENQARLEELRQELQAPKLNATATLTRERIFVPFNTGETSMPHTQITKAVYDHFQSRDHLRHIEVTLTNSGREPAANVVLTIELLHEVQNVQVRRPHQDSDLEVFKDEKLVLTKIPKILPGLKVHVDVEVSARYFVPTGPNSRFKVDSISGGYSSSGEDDGASVLIYGLDIPFVKSVVASCDNCLEAAKVGQ